MYIAMNFTSVVLLLCVAEPCQIWLKNYSALLGTTVELDRRPTVVSGSTV